MMCDKGPCPFFPEECRLAKVFRDPCCTALCSDGDMWRDRSGLAGFLTNFTRAILGAAKNPEYTAAKADALTPFRRNATTNEDYPIRHVAEITTNPRVRFRNVHDKGILSDWDSTELDGDYGETATSGGYDAVVIGITLLILCLLVIGIIFVMALYRLRRIRLISAIRRSNSQPDTNAQILPAALPSISQMVQDPPPPYEIWKPVCAEPPPSYEQHIQMQSLASGETDNPPRDVAANGASISASDSVADHNRSLPVNV